MFGLLIGVLLARLLGPEKKGIVTTALVIPSLVLTIADLGFRQAATYFMGKRLYPDQVVISTLLFTSLLASLLGMIAALLSYLWSGLPYRYGWAVALVPLLMMPLRLIAINADGVLLAKQQIQRLAVSTTLAELTLFVLVLGLYYLDFNRVEWVLLAYALSALIPVIYILNIVRNYGSLTPAYHLEIFWPMLSKGLIYAVALFVVNLNYSLGVVILERLTGAAEVGIFSIGVSIANLLWMLPNALTVVTFSHSVAAVDEIAYAHRTAQLLRVVLCLAIIPLWILYMLSPYVIPWLYTSQFAQSGSIVQAILPGVWAMLIYKVLNGDLAGRGKPHVALWVFLLALAVNVVLNFWWDPEYGALGSAWASNVSYWVGAVLYAAAYARISQLRLVDLFIPRCEDVALICKRLTDMTKA
jgi:O-antigen/teichoic acid export membrane protein